MNEKITDNFKRLKYSLFWLPLFIIIFIIIFLFSQNALSVHSYIQIQKDCFFYLNLKLSKFPETEYNLTQFGDPLVFLSLLSIFVLYAPKLWECLIPATLISALFSRILKTIFGVPRPAAVFDNKSFEIIGKTLSGNNSLPSGHSIFVFTIMTVLLFAFMPSKAGYKILWFFFMFFIGLIFVFSRVGVGAHYPMDVVVGCVIGYISGLAGIFASRKYPIWNWIRIRKFYPIFIVSFLACCIWLFNKMVNEGLVIFYLSFIAILVSLYKITAVYVKK